MERISPRGRLKLRWLDRVNADSRENSAQVVDAQDRKSVRCARRHAENGTEANSAAVRD